MSDIPDDPGHPLPPPEPLFDPQYQPEQARQRPRVVVVETVYHQPPDSETISEDSQYSINLTSEDDAYCRTMRLTSQWTPLDVGWIKGPCSVVYLRNESTTPLTSTFSGEEGSGHVDSGSDGSGSLLPQREQRDVETIVEVTTVDRLNMRHDDEEKAVLFRLRPGESCRLPLERPQCLRLRVKDGKGKCRIMLVPA